jgi:TRAP-type C4-dicarboxylate transport system substrate-binding protein
MKVEIFPNEQLGTEKELIEALQLGYLAMTKVSVVHPDGISELLNLFKPILGQHGKLVEIDYGIVV